MKLLKRYLSQTIVMSVGLVALMIFCLQIFILFIDQIGSIGQGDFSAFEACLFVLLSSPYQVYLSFPLIGLLGCLLGLGWLANHNELLVMRAAGVSVAQITGHMLTIVLIITVLVTCLGESVVPKWMAYAEHRKTIMRSGGQVLPMNSGLWWRSGNHFIHIEKIMSRQHLRGISDYFFDEQQHLKSIWYAKQARYRHDDWLLLDVDMSLLSKTHVTTRHYTKLIWPIKLPPRLLILARTKPQAMSLWQLYSYIQEQKNESSKC